MTRGLRNAVEDDIGFRIERDLPNSSKTEPTVLTGEACDFIGAIGIDGLGHLAGESQDDGLVRPVALAGPGERTEQDDLSLIDFRKRAGLLEVLHELGRGLHRTDGVR